MDLDGWIPLEVIAGFNRVRTLTRDPVVIVEALMVRRGGGRGGAWLQPDTADTDPIFTPPNQARIHTFFMPCRSSCRTLPT